MDRCDASHATESVSGAEFRPRRIGEQPGSDTSGACMAFVVGNAAYVTCENVGGLFGRH